MLNSSHTGHCFQQHYFCFGSHHGLAESTLARVNGRGFSSWLWNGSPIWPSATYFTSLSSISPPTQCLVCQFRLLALWGRDHGSLCVCTVPSIVGSWSHLEPLGATITQTKVIYTRVTESRASLNLFQLNYIATLTVLFLDLLPQTQQTQDWWYVCTWDKNWMWKIPKDINVNTKEDKKRSTQNCL